LICSLNMPVGHETFCVSYRPIFQLDVGANLYPLHSKALSWSSISTEDLFNIVFQLDKFQIFLFFNWISFNNYLNKFQKYLRLSSCIRFSKCWNAWCVVLISYLFKLRCSHYGCNDTSSGPYWTYENMNDLLHALQCLDKIANATHAWAQFGGGHGRRVPHFFGWGDIICHVPTLFSL